ncbi:13867_t:CDS:2 [Funneliformis caledonium]|uniref:13867_t:CDS:1 n=1 Tax=Funneliformis caledonium TaxID=1117310 RepID=A0A9N9BWJ0_9GLOM|nr:13867_t:CDS:2 [Funneliformis caledonium]
MSPKRSIIRSQKMKQNVIPVDKVEVGALALKTNAKRKAVVAPMIISKYN